MAAWTKVCAARLEQARTELARGDDAFAKAQVKIEANAVSLTVTSGSSMYLVRVALTSPTSPARNSWNPPRDTWVDLPIIDKSYSTQKLNLFRWSARLEGTIAAYRGDSSPRSPPVPGWLKPFVDLSKPAVEDCLGG